MAGAPIIAQPGRFLVVGVADSGVRFDQPVQDVQFDQAVTKAADTGLAGRVVLDGEAGEADEGQRGQERLFNARIAQVVPALGQQDLSMDREGEAGLLMALVLRMSFLFRKAWMGCQSIMLSISSRNVGLNLR